MKISNLKPRRGELLDAMLAFRRVFYALGWFSLAVNVLLLVPSIYMLQVYDRVITSRNESTLLLLTLLMFGLLALEAALEFVRGRIMVRVGAALDQRVDVRVFDAVFERTLAGGGENAGRAFANLSAVRQFLTGKGLFAFFDVPWTPMYILIVFMLNPWLGLFALVAAAILLALAWLNERATAPLFAEAGKLGAAANYYATAQLRNAEAIAAMGMLGGVARALGRALQPLSCGAKRSQRSCSQHQCSDAFFSVRISVGDSRSGCVAGSAEPTHSRGHGRSLDSARAYARSGGSGDCHVARIYFGTRGLYATE